MTYNSSTSLLVEWVGPHPREYSETTLEKVANGADRALGEKLVNRMVYIKWKNQELAATVLAFGGHMEEYKERAGELRLTEIEKYGGTKEAKDGGRRERKVNAKYNGEYDTGDGKRKQVSKVSSKPKTKKTEEGETKAAKIAKILSSLPSLPSTSVELEQQERIEVYTGSAPFVTDTELNDFGIQDPQVANLNPVALLASRNKSAYGTTAVGNLITKATFQRDTVSTIKIADGSDQLVVADSSTIPKMVLVRNEAGDVDVEYWKRRCQNLEATNSALEIKITETERGSVEVQDKLNAELRKANSQEHFGAGLYITTAEKESLKAAALSQLYPTSAFALSLFRKHFSYEELSTCSWAGRNCPANQQLEPRPYRPGVDKEKRKAITDLTMVVMEGKGREPPPCLTGDDRNRWLVERRRAGTEIRNSVGHMLNENHVKRFPESRRKRTKGENSQLRLETNNGEAEK